MDTREQFRIPKEEPCQCFPIGAIIEDAKGIYKVLSMEKQDKAHKYKVEVIKQKIPIPDHMKPFIDEKQQVLLVLPQNLPSITRLE